MWYKRYEICFSKTYAPDTRIKMCHSSDSLKDYMISVILLCLQDQQSQKERSRLTTEATEWLIKHKIKAFCAIADGPCMALAARTLMCNVGLGKLRPNVVLMGYKTTWKTCPPEELQSYFKTIQ